MGKKSRTSTGEKSTPHILVIRLSAMGDVAMTVPVISALAKQYPHLKITVLTRAFFRPMFSEVPKISVYTADVKGRHKGVAGLWKLYQELKAIRIDVVADLHHVLRSNILKKFFFLDAVPFVQIDKGRAEKKSLTALNNKVFKPLKTTHERYADVFSRLGFPLDLDHTVVLPRQALSDKMLRIVGSDAKRWIGIAPFAAFEGKTYPADLMEKVIRAINNTEKYKVLFFGGAKEKATLDNWEKQFGHSVNIAGKLSFQEELALISNLDLMLAMDSGNAHLSAMYGVPTLTLWGVTHPYAGFYPFKQDADNALLSDRKTYPLIPTSVYGNKMPKGYGKAMETISPQEVFLKVNEILNSS